MIIDRVRLTLSDPVSAGRFFADVLELPAGRHGADVEVTVGRSRLVLAAAGPAPAAGVHHLAFDVPAETFDAHRDWLAGRVPLLQSADGSTEFEGPLSWNSRSVYFAGPEGMVLELIARRSQRFDVRAAPQLICVSEVGVAVPDVLATAAELAETWGLEVLGSAGADFAPVGDHDGLLILVRPGRGWLPVFDVVSAMLPVDVKVTIAGASGSVALTDLASVTA